MRLVNRGIYLLFAMVLAGCASKPVPQVAVDPNVPSVLLVADPQIHHVFGGTVKQASEAADLFSGVARRHPETNLLAPFAMQDLIERAEKTKPSSPFMVVLGDATNAACTAEFDTFMRAVKPQGSKRIVLLAHGNHDSYLMGTLNYWQPFDPASLNYDRFKAAALPPDVSWWPAFAIQNNDDAEGWRALCYQSKEKSKPMHKVQWIAKYLASLKDEIDVDPLPNTGTELLFSARGKSGSVLAGLNYDLKGLWKRPHGGGRGLIESYDSFLVQAVNIGETDRLILIDTSACAYFDRPNLWPRAAWQNFGRHGCMGTAQITMIKELANSKDSEGKRIIFAGHFPLNKIAGSDRNELVQIMKKAKEKTWTYISAHTHDEDTKKQHEDGGTEFNISSTTDWPAGAFRLQLGQTISMARIGDDTSPMSYAPPGRSMNGPELCRHLEAAEHLAMLKVNVNDTKYESPAKWDGYEDCKKPGTSKWDSYEERLLTAVGKIEERMKGENDKAFKQYALRVMSAASLHESQKMTVLKFLGLFVR